MQWQVYNSSILYILAKGPIYRLSNHTTGCNVHLDTPSSYGPLALLCYVPLPSTPSFWYISTHPRFSPQVLCRPIHTLFTNEMRE
jgi:hypothetical protein